VNYIKVGVREVKVKLSKFLKAIENGSVIIITNRGLPIAKISKPSDSDIDLSQTIANLEDIGILKSLVKKEEQMIMPPPLILKGIDAQKILAQDRNGE
jgi:prevent-host-death family protein